MYRKSYAFVRKDILTKNIEEITSKYHYDYYIGVVKNNSYHHGIGAIEALIAGGINYLAVSSLDEALEIREKYKQIPILVLEPVNLLYLDEVLKNNITLTVDNKSYVEKLVQLNIKGKLNIHLKLDTGMNRLGFKDTQELREAYNILNACKSVFIEGVYTHFATSGRGDVFYLKQYKKLNKLLEVIDVEKIPIRHFDRSITMVSHEKIPISNGVRLGIIMYGFNESVYPRIKGIKNKLRLWKQKMYIKQGLMQEYTTTNSLVLKNAYHLYSEVISVRKVEVGEVVGYNAAYQVKEKGFILTIAIGYADGVTKEFGQVDINGCKHDIVSDSMDMLMVFSKDKIDVGSKVEIIGEHLPVRLIARNLGINAYHLFNQISARIPIVYEEALSEKREN